MGKRTEFNLRTVPMLFGVIDENVTRGDLLVDILKLNLNVKWANAVVMNYKKQC